MVSCAGVVSKGSVASYVKYSSSSVMVVLSSIVLVKYIVVTARVEEQAKVTSFLPALDVLPEAEVLELLPIIFA